MHHKLSFLEMLYYFGSQQVSVQKYFMSTQHLLFFFGITSNMLARTELFDHFTAKGLNLLLGMDFSLVFRKHIHIPNCWERDDYELKDINCLLSRRRMEINKNQPKT